MREWPTPGPGHGEVLIKVAGCGLNHLDLWVRDGLPGVAPMPHILGSEVAGRIAALGGPVEGLAVGDAVIVVPGHGCGRCALCNEGRESICPRFTVLGNQRQGGCAEFVVVDQRDCIKVGDRIPLTNWAAVPLVFQTAWHMLFDLGHLKTGETVLIESAGSGVGTAAIQIAKLAGARVIATVGGEAKCRRVADLGADIAIDHQANDVRKDVREVTGGQGADVVFAHVGGPNFASTLACLARGGRLVTCGATAGPNIEIDLRFVFTRELTITGAYLGTRSNLDRVVELVNAGKLQPVVEHVYRLDEIRDAHARMARRDLVGKLVIAP